MRVDPPEHCRLATMRERRLWALLHDLVAHPLMAVTGYASWAVRFHDWTGRRAWIATHRLPPPL